MRQLIEPLRVLPLLKIVVGFSLGVAISVEVGFGWYYYLPILLLGVLFLIWGYSNQKYSERWLFGLGVMLFLFCTGASYVAGIRNLNVDLPKPEKAFLTLQVDDNPIKTRYGYRWTSVVIQASDSLKGVLGSKCATFSRDSILPNYGDLLHVRCLISAVEPPKNPYEFNFKEYYSHQGIFSVASIGKGGIHTVGKGRSFFLVRWAKAIQKYTLETFQRASFAKDELGILVALMIGDKQFLDGDLKSSYANIGAMHILAVSGMHVALIYGVLVVLLFFMKDRRILWVRSVAILCALWLYAFVAGFSPSIVRATIMFTFILVGKLINRDYNIYNLVAASFLVLLLVNPFFLYDVGFLLSYAAVISILLFYKPLSIYAPHNKVARWFYDLVAVSIAAQILTMPLVLYYFHQFPLIFLLTNIVLIPLTSLIIYMALVYLAISWWSLGCYYLDVALNWLLRITNIATLHLEGIPNAIISGIYLNRWQMLALFAAFVLFYIFMIYRKALLLIISLSVILVVACKSFWGQLDSCKNRLVVYSQRGGTSILFGQGQGAICLCDSVRDRYSYKFMEPSLVRWGLGGVGDVRFCKMNDAVRLGGVDIKDGWCSFNSKFIFIPHRLASSRIGAKERVVVDLVIITKKCRWKPETLFKVLAPKVVVVDESVSNYWEKKWDEGCDEANVPFYSVKASGAYRLDM